MPPELRYRARNKHIGVSVLSITAVVPLILSGLTALRLFNWKVMGSNYRHFVDTEKAERLKEGLAL